MNVATLLASTERASAAALLSTAALEGMVTLGIVIEGIETDDGMEMVIVNELDGKGMTTTDDDAAAAATDDVVVDDDEEDDVAAATAAINDDEDEDDADEVDVAFTACEEDNDDDVDVCFFEVLVLEDVVVEGLEEGNNETGRLVPPRIGLSRGVASVSRGVDVVTGVGNTVTVLTLAVVTVDVCEGGVAVCIGPRGCR